MYFLETSAKEAENVERLFMEIAVELMEVKIYYIMQVFSVNVMVVTSIPNRGNRFSLSPNITKH